MLSVIPMGFCLAFLIPTVLRALWLDWVTLCFSTRTFVSVLLSALIYTYSTKFILSMYGSSDVCIAVV